MMLSKLPLWVLRLLPWVIVVGALVFAISFCLALDDLTKALIMVWLS